MPKKHFLTIFFALVFSLLFLSVIYLMLGNKNVPLTEILVNKMVKIAKINKSLSHRISLIRQWIYCSNYD